MAGLLYNFCFSLHHFFYGMKYSCFVRFLSGLLDLFTSCQRINNSNEESNIIFDG
jgi:hypothetical protein